MSLFEPRECIAVLFLLTKASGCVLGADWTFAQGQGYDQTKQAASSRPSRLLSMRRVPPLREIAEFGSKKFPVLDSCLFFRLRTAFERKLTLCRFHSVESFDGLSPSALAGFLPVFRQLLGQPRLLNKH